MCMNFDSPTDLLKLASDKQTDLWKRKFELRNETNFAFLGALSLLTLHAHALWVEN